jgi:hypothetical protein
MSEKNTRPNERILIVSNSLTGGGAEKSMLLLHKQLQNLKATQAPDDDDASTGTVLDEMRTLSIYSAINLRPGVHIFIGRVRLSAA